MSEQKPIEIPQKYEQEFTRLLTELEQETGSMYELKIFKYGTYTDNQKIIGELSKRKFPVEVYDMEDKYKRLNGIYESTDAIKVKLFELDIEDHRDFNTRIELAKQATSIIGKIFNATANESYESIWSEINVSTSDNVIWISGGDVSDMTIMNIIGKYKAV